MPKIQVSIGCFIIFALFCTYVSAGSALLWFINSVATFKITNIFCFKLPGKELIVRWLKCICLPCSHKNEDFTVNKNCKGAVISSEHGSYLTGCFEIKVLSAPWATFRNPSSYLFNTLFDLQPTSLPLIEMLHILLQLLLCCNCKILRFDTSGYYKCLV